MNIFHKTQKKETRKLPMTGKVKKGFRYYCAAVLSVTAVFAMSTTAFAASTKGNRFYFFPFQHSFPRRVGPFPQTPEKSARRPQKGSGNCRMQSL